MSNFRSFAAFTTFLCSRILGPVDTATVFCRNRVAPLLRLLLMDAEKECTSCAMASSKSYLSCFSFGISTDKVSLGFLTWDSIFLILSLNFLLEHDLRLLSVPVRVVSGSERFDWIWDM